MENKINMAKTINREALRNIITETVMEALKYDKDSRQYFPNYTGNKHSDAGKYGNSYKDDYDYTRNDYQWHSQKNQDRFNRLQARKGLEIDPANPDRDNEGGAREYMEQHDGDTLSRRAVEELSPKFDRLIREFCANAIKQYPIFNDSTYLMDLKHALQDVIHDL